MEEVDGYALRAGRRVTRIRIEGASVARTPRPYRRPLAFALIFLLLATGPVLSVVVCLVTVGGLLWLSGHLTRSRPCARLILNPKVAFGASGDVLDRYRMSNVQVVPQDGGARYQLIIDYDDTPKVFVRDLTEPQALALERDLSFWLDAPYRETVIERRCIDAEFPAGTYPRPLLESVAYGLAVATAGALPFRW